MITRTIKLTRSEQFWSAVDRLQADDIDLKSALNTLLDAVESGVSNRDSREADALAELFGHDEMERVRSLLSDEDDV